MTIARTAALIVALLIAAADAAQTGRGATRAVTIRSHDGRAVSALHVETVQRPAPAVVLVPMLGRPKEDWQGVAERLADMNITGVAVDLPAQSLPEDPKDLAGWQFAVTAAVDYLSARPDVRGSSIGVVGASLGANLAVLAAASDTRVRSLALVSPSLDYRGVRIEAALKQYGERSALLLSSRHDPYAARSTRELATGGPGLREAHWADSPAHGTVLLAQDPDLVNTLVEWFRRTLG